jgi:ferritin-like metal-binding protein YciE
MPPTPEEQLIKYLTDAHAIERQALVQMRMAPKIAEDQGLVRIFDQHRAETEDHERRVSERLEAHGAKPSTVQDLAMEAGGVGFGLFARFQPDTPGKLVCHALSYEHLELAAYELLAHVAERAGDEDTATTARAIRDSEREMAGRLEQSLDAAANASLVPERDIGGQLATYLADAHGIEAQAIELLQRGPGIVSDQEIGELFTEHLAETREHQRLGDERLRAHGAAPSRVKETALRLAGLNWGGFFAAQPDSPGKLVAFAHAFEYLEVGAYELLSRVAQRASDQDTVAVAQRILGEERAAADKLASQLDRAAEASLHEQGITA